jgi:sirohydrochlorin cobaltochelatase
LSSVYLLVSHGSRDPRPQIAVTDLAQQLSTWFALRSCPSILANTTPTTHPIVVTAGLELGDRPLHQEIIALLQSCREQEIDRAIVLPLFLLPGVHVMEDIPREIELARATIGDRVELKIAPYLGSYADIARLLSPERQNLPSQSILLAHGSRRGGGNERVERLARSLDLTPAYWSVTPSLIDRVADLVRQGATEIGILPYFLFPGGITDAIADLVVDLNSQFPTTNLLTQSVPILS